VADCAQLNYEVEGTRRFSVDVKATDASAASATQTVTIAVLNTNDQPIVRSEQRFTIPENSALATQLAVVGTGAPAVVLASDEDAGSTLTFAITNVSPASANGLFVIDSSTGALLTKASGDLSGLDFEAISGPITLTVSATDNGAGAADPTPRSGTGNVVVTVTDVNERPTLTSSQV